MTPSNPICIRTAMLLLLAVAMLPSLVVQGGIYYRWFRTDEQREVQSNLELARALASTFDAFIHDLGNHEITLGAAIVAKRFSFEEMNKLFATSAQNYPALNAFIFLDPNGRIAASSDPRLIGVVAGDREYFQRAKRNESFVLSDLLEGRADQNPIFIVATGIFDGNEFLGVLAGSVNPDRLGEATLRVDRAGGGGVSFYDRTGCLVYRYPSRGITWAERRSRETGGLMERALGGHEAQGAFRMEEDERLGARVPISNLGWVAGASGRKKALMWPLMQNMLQIIVVNILVLLVSVGGAWYISRMIVRRLRQLREHALAVGSGKLDRTAEQCGITELRDLAAAFNQMVLQRRRTEEELARSNQDLEQFAYVASHDLQEPLRMIRGHLQIIHRHLENKLEEDTRTSMGFVEDGALRMQTLISDLLAYSRIDSQKKPLEDTDANAAAAEAICQLRPAIDEAGAEVKMDSLPVVRADPLQLARLFQNLIGNAIKYRRPDVRPEILIGATRERDAWKFWVKDNGIGIDPRFKDEVFVVFRRLHSRDNYPGSGIGLSICKRIIDRHRGAIWVESQLGQGAAFYFTIPDKPEAEE